jgi:hypothetical protein
MTVSGAAAETTRNTIPAVPNAFLFRFAVGTGAAPMAAAEGGVLMMCLPE